MMGVWKGSHMYSDIFYYDVAAVFVMAVALLSFVMRRKTHAPANHVYFSTLLLVTFTTVLSLACDLSDAFLGAAFTQELASSMPPLFVLRSACALLYYALRPLTALAYLVLIATVSSTSHKLSQSMAARLLLWVPALAVVAFVLTNPLHHLVYYFNNGVQTRGPCVGVIYASAVYYSIWGIAWLIRWKEVLSTDEFATLMMLYPLVFVSVIIQYFYPFLLVEMFVTSVAMLLVSAFVLRPEQQLDSLVNAASLHAYRETCRRALITQKPLCLIYVEIVNVEQLRELMGKDDMQDVMSGVAHRLGGRLERGDVLYYLRNGLFCIMLQNVDPTRAMARAQRGHDEDKRRARAKGYAATEVRLRTCVISVPQDIHTIEELRTFVRRFSHLMPKPGVTTFAELAKRDDFALQMALPQIVANAIRERSFQIHYQPIRCLADNRFHSAEALVRLHDPTYGWVPPSLFIPEAEQSGVIIQIGDILLDKICAFLGSIDYDALDLWYVELNLSVEQCVRPQLANRIIELVHTYDVDPARINLEITETSPTFSLEAIETNVRKLAAHGITFSLDDYGTGYSNVIRALQLPVKLIKFDRTFASNLDDPKSRCVLARSISMMKEIGKSVLVEGVETREQAEALRSMGVDFIQGYLYAKPIPEDELIAFIQRPATE